MAKKIIIAFDEQPIVPEIGWQFEISVNDIILTYNNGSTTNQVIFMANGDDPPDSDSLPIGVDLNETLLKTLSYLQTNFVNNLITYTIVNNTIEVRIEADAVVGFGDIINPSLTITTQDVEPDTINLKYFLIYGDYLLNIYKKNYVGDASEIHGEVVITKGSVDTILETIRGTGLNLSLEANETLTFDEFILEEEFTYKTELKKSGVTIFNGYIKPDGVQQSYVADEWIINITSTDGLGALKDLSFVQTNGLPFKDKLSMYEVIKGCLDRTRLSMPINTSVDLSYLDYSGTNILKDTYVNSDRFIKSDQDKVLMDCNEVMNSVLNLFSAVITQQDGQWWVYRPNDIGNGYATFINQTTNTTFVKNMNVELGSQIDNFYPHHCGGNQQIEVKGAISAYRLNYQYGFLDGYIVNSNLNHDGELNYAGWNKLADFNEKVINVPNHLSGLVMTPTISFNPSSPKRILECNSFFIEKDSTLTFKTKLTSFSYAFVFLFKIKTSDNYYLNRYYSGSNQEPFWSTNANSYVEVLCGEVNNQNTSILDFTLNLPPMPNDCTVSVSIISPKIVPFLFTQVALTEINYIQITDDILKKNGWVGEFHTVTRGNPPSSITKENQKVFNGDSSNLFIGAIYKSDKINTTTLWTRKNRFEQKALLQISAEDDLRIQSSAIKVFSGDIYGEIPYLSIVKINNIFGKFMFIEYNYNIKTNISSVKLLQFFDNELGDIQYLFSYDYGNNTIKPTIVG